VLVKDRPTGIDTGRAERTSGRPVVLGTLSCRIDPAAERMAVESALEAGSPLLVANVVYLPNYPTTLMLVGPDAATLPHEEDLEAVRATADRAAGLGIRTEHLRVSSKRPVKALLEVARDRRAGLLVFGPDRTRIPGRRFRRAAREIRKRAECLVWIAPDG
jgi:nucleotide-binding universal stress UspA family protein